MFTTRPPGLGGVAWAAGGDVDRLQDLDEVLAGVATRVQRPQPVHSTSPNLSG